MNLKEIERNLKKENRIWIVPNNDLEAKTIIELLERNEEALIVTSQGWGASWENLELEIKEKIEEVKKMSATGVDGLVFVTKGYGCDDDYIVHYLCSLAEHTELPVLLYEFPGFPNNKMTANAYAKLVETGKFVGIKDTTSQMPTIKEKIAVQGESNVLQANIPYLFEAYKAGARGVIATPSTCGSYMLRKMYDAFFVENDIEKAEKIHRFVDIFAETVDNGFTASGKYMASLCGAKMNLHTRTGSSINDQKKHSLEVLRDFALSEGLMRK